MKRRIARKAQQGLGSPQTRPWRSSSLLLRVVFQRPRGRRAIVATVLLIYLLYSLTLSRMLTKSRGSGASGRLRHDKHSMVHVESADQPNVPKFDYNTPPVATLTTLPEPVLSDTARNRRIVLLVLSSRENLAQRSMIRRTWGANQTILFAIGGCCNPTNTDASIDEATRQKEQFRLVDEQQAHQDLLDTIHPESYRSLPHKLRYGMSWIVQHLRDAEWILKADDDMYVRAAMFQVLVNGRSSMLLASEAAIIGHVVRNTPVERGGKWAEHGYVNPIYPPWPQGSCGYAVSRAVGEYIASQYEQDLLQQPAKPRLQLYQGEDTSLGIWMEQSNVSVSWIDSSLFVNHGNCMVAGSIGPNDARQNTTVAWSIGHRISPERMLECYAADQRRDRPLVSAFTMPPHQLLALYSHVSTAALEPPKDKAFWSAMDLHQSNEEANQRRESLVQRREERAKRRQALQ